jgi:hypothetical protein
MNPHRILTILVILLSIVGFVACTKQSKPCYCERFTPLTEGKYRHEQGLLTRNGFDRTQMLEMTYVNECDRKAIETVSGKVLISKLLALHGYANGHKLSTESILINANEYLIVGP